MERLNTVLEKIAMSVEERKDISERFHKVEDKVKNMLPYYEFNILGPSEDHVKVINKSLYKLLYYMDNIVGACYKSIDSRLTKIEEYLALVTKS